ncbi:bifunctional methylenetetrahydrofolate dehydrogenase/methenyltetrahydrofolate cyclohydrolase FolD [bacterium]|nr:bifunctional methylenetetrahydrofolate dehydrogenase/methenyltetrahydrofolate cyclohydrolase FolD [bacterium]
MAEIIDGKKIASEIQGELKVEIEELKKGGVTPGLATILVGTNPASQVYVRNKTSACEKIGIYSEQHTLSYETKEKELLELIEGLNKKPNIDGILVQLPLPSQIEEKRVLAAILPEKDVDGFHYYNVGRFFCEKSYLEMKRENLLLPCTPYGIMEMLLRSHFEINGKEAVVLGRSNIVGKPIALLLLSANATVTICHSKTSNLQDVTSRADILVAAIGIPCFVKKDMVKRGAVVIDVGINRMNDKIVGDVDFTEVSEVCKAITPVPGGVGPMTITMLLANTLTSAKRRKGNSLAI